MQRRAGAGVGGPDPSSQRILRSLSSKGGERKRLTVLFADIRNSTSLIDSLGDPELGMRRLEPVLELMKDAVHRYDGIVNKIQGDGVMALFGAPRPHEDHAVRGCLAALAMQDAISRGSMTRTCRSASACTPAKWWFRPSKTASTRPTTRRAPTSISQTAWSRWRTRAASSSPATPIAAAKQFVEVVPLGMQTVRGIAAPVETFKLTGLLNAPASGVFRSGRRLTA